MCAASLQKPVKMSGEHSGKQDKKNDSAAGGREISAGCGFVRVALILGLQFLYGDGILFKENLREKGARWYLCSFVCA